MKLNCLYKNSPRFLYSLLLVSMISCSQQPFVPIHEVPDIELTTNKIAQTSQTFVNTTNNQPVSLLHSLENTNFHFYNSVKFKNQNVGILVGGTGLRTRITEDGGKNWAEYSFSKFANAFHSVAFSGQSLFIIGESDYIFKSTDLGDNWSVFNTASFFEEQSPLSQTKLLKIRFLDDKTGFIAGGIDQNPLLLKTTSAGDQWAMVQGIETLTEGNLITYFSILSEQELYLVTVAGNCYKTEDGGLNWSLLYETKSLNAIAFKNARIGLMGGIDGTLLYTANGGADWTPVEVPERAIVTDIIFVENGALITTAKAYAESREIFVFKLDENELKLTPFLTKNDDSIQFIGESYAIDKLDDDIYILDRNNLYKTTANE